jgi:ATP-dependent DNA helicase
MAFKGLFVGIDRYASADINWLSCARRDATALHALFGDTLGGDSALVVDEQATKEMLRLGFEKLSCCDADDVVVIGFSGHGTSTHELVLYDTNLRDIAATTISLTELAEWFAKIPARRLLLILDCCFSGGMGAKVLQIEATPRDVTSVGVKLDLLGGNGRIILTASGPTQEAYENPRHGHGLLTSEVLTALQGPEELRDQDRIGIYGLLEWVTRRVSDAARQIGRVQEPTVRGTFDGELVWPVFARGPLYATAFPDRGRPEAIPDVHSLSAFGFPDALLQAWAGEIPTLNQLQLSAINEYGVLNGEHLVVSAPTSSGKTMVGELAALRGALDRRRALFLFPLKALVADKLRQFRRVYGPFGIRIIEATGETDDLTPLMRGRYDIALLTYEKFMNIALTHPYILDQVGTIVIDEVQMIADESRGANLEFLLTLLQMHRRRGVEPQMIALSAVIGQTNGLERWLGARLLRREQRPVPLDEGLLCGDGRFRYVHSLTGEERSEPYITPDRGEGKSRDWVIPLVRRLVGEGKQVIVFRETTGETRHCARYLAEALHLPPASAALAALPTGDPSQASGELREVLQRGVAFHNSHLSSGERPVVEEQFRVPNATLRVIAATTTLAMGVNTPASAVVIVGLEHPLQKPYSVAEYKNLAGRAGRLGYTEHGLSFLLAQDGRAEHEYWRRYVTAHPEDLASRFLGADIRTLIMRVMTSAQRVGGMTREEVIGFLESSFGAFQESQRADGWKWNASQLNDALNELASHRMIEQGDGGRYSVTPLGRLAGESAVEVESVIRVVGYLSALRPGDITDPVLIVAAQLTVELDALHFPINRKSTQKEPQAWLGELQRQALPQVTLRSLQQHAAEQVTATLRAKKAVACLYYVAGTQMSEIERAMTQFGGSFDGAAGPIRSVASRTCDVLPMVARVAELLHAGLDVSTQTSRLVVRLEYGVTAEAVDLARVAGRELGRGDYRRLTAAGLTRPETIEAASDELIFEHIDGDREKLRVVRRFAETARVNESLLASIPALEPYKQ